jgi:glutamate-1-semialdehyde 2,1-aminomutase
LTHGFTYNDLESLNRVLTEHSGDVAAVILEPMNSQAPKDGFLEGVKELTHRHGALLVFDEVITGFRFANGGAQEFFGVTPDLACFGKGVANGYPVSAIAGRADIMKLMEEIFFSFTFGGETLSLAASLATLQKLKREPVLATVRQKGERLIEGVKKLFARHGMDDLLTVSGHPTWSFLNFRDQGGYSLYEIKTLFLQEVFARGLLTLGTHNLSYAHSDGDIDRVLGVYDEVFPLLKSAVSERRLAQLLRCKPLEPLFKLR